MHHYHFKPIPHPDQIVRVTQTCYSEVIGCWITFLDKSTDEFEYIAISVFARKKVRVFILK